QAITTYLQIINKSVAIKEILNCEEIISIVQANKNKEPIRQEIDEDKVSDLPIIATKVFNTMQTVICYEKQKILELNLLLEKLEFLRNLLKEYKH
ncbi:1413_t:CDS:1, partial [Gigaspora margarita]